MENTIFINFNNLLEFGRLIQHAVKIVRNQIFLQIQMHPFGNYKFYQETCRIEILFISYFENKLV